MELVGTDKECSGSVIRPYYFEDDTYPELCAKECVGVASMFTLCNSIDCYCQTSASKNGTCNVINKDGCELYKLKGMPYKSCQHYQCL